jgi:ketosteroid isomerase-like protein
MAVAQIPRSNIEIIFVDWLDAMRRGDLDRMASRLAPDAVHQGVRPDLICRNREEVVDNARRRVGKQPDVEALELVAAGDHVVMSVRAANVGVPVGDTADEFRGQACVVFTLHEGQIVRIQDYVHRAEAFDAAGASIDWD